MPFLSNITDLKSLTRQFDVLGVFGDQPVPTADKVDGSQSGEKVASTSTPSAIAGPGPSTRALSEDKNATLTLPSPTSRPVRPSLKSTPSSSLSFDEEAGRRRTSNNSVTIVDPVNGPLDRKAGADTDAIQTKRRSGPNSIASAVGSGMPLEARRRRRAPLDTYIIVRPPPTSAKNPLNLQIQLVVKDTRTRDRSVSAVSTRSNSVSTDASASSVPVTPATPSSELPPRDSSSFELPSALKQRSASPAQMSSDDAEETDGAPLRRTTSLGSNVSSNTSSTATSGGHRKRVEPMFNLAVHSVMQPTVVTDASTDAKVAKFLKRALDVNGVGILEPAEVWLPPSNAPSSANLVPPTDNFQPRSRPVSMMSLTVPLSPTTTRQSELTSANIRNSLDLAFKRTSMELSQVKNSVNPEGGAKKFFGKMFKKKTATETASVPADSRKSLTITRKRSHSPSPPSGEVVGPVDEHGHHHYGHSTFGTAPVVIRRRSSGTMVTSDGAITGLTAPSVPPPSAGLGLSPPSLTDNCTTLPLLPSTRPVGYTWSVKKWAKRNSEGWAAHLVAAAAAGLDLVHGGFAGEGDDQVVFEWVKMRSPANTAGSSYLRRITTNNTAASAASRPVPKKKRSRTASLRGDVSPGLEPESAKLAVTPNPTSRPTSPRASPRMDPRPEPVRRVSASLSSSSRRNSSAPPSIIESEKDQDASSIDSPDLTADEESDPEDSETPWTCSVWVKKTGQRQLLGTLTPAPHHPKVIAALKIPMTLDTVSLTSINPPTTTAHAEAAKRVEAEVCLTEENLKDVVCVTAMWLAAREEFGGLGRKKRSVKC